jgi:hypothetical protein
MVLGHDALGAELAGVLEHHGALLGEVLVEQDAGLAST